MNKIRCVVFDVGGVLVELTGAQELLKLTGEKYRSEAALGEAWIRSPVVRSYESGRCSRRAFARKIVDELELPIAADQFIERFSSWANGLFPGAKQLLEQVKRNYPIACLSNTNELHWPHQRDADYLNNIFDNMFLSYQMGMVKPDQEIYLSMIDLLGFPPGQILFIDDNQVNIDAAYNVGLQACRAKGIDQLQSVLLDYNCIDGRFT